MNPITNSNIKEGFRIANEEAASRKIDAINIKANEDIAKLKYKKLDYGNWGCIGAIIGVFTMGIGFAVLTIAYFIFKASVTSYNEEIDAMKKKIRDDADADIRRVKREADQKTQREIKAYDEEVKLFAKRIMTKAQALTPMLNHVTMMFERMVSHADKGSHMRFIETDFIYEVTKTRIAYYYQSTYSNDKDDYDFDKNRYKPLTKDTECEGLSQVIARLSIKQMQLKYPPNSLNVKVEHNDAKVTIHFRVANPNFINSTSIV